MAITGLPRHWPLVLASSAGFCDTATFLRLHNLFSAHVTGNFVLFAAAAARGLRPDDYLKLLTFFAFAVTIALTSAAVARLPSPNCGWAPMLLTAEAGALAASALIFLLAGAQEIQGRLTFAAAAGACSVVAGMALQNGFRRWCDLPGAPTTVMTGNMAGAIIELVDILSGRPGPVREKSPVWSVLASFALGCVAGAWLSKVLGLPALIVPAATVGALAAGAWRGQNKNASVVEK